MFKHAGPRLRQFSLHWGMGVWIGRNELGGDRILATPHGIERATTATRPPLPETRPQEFLAQCCGLPWDTHPVPPPPKKKGACC